MEFRFTFRHMETSPAVADYAKKKIADVVDKYVPNPIEVHMKFDFEHDKNIASCQVLAGEGFNLQVHDEGEVMYACIDKLVDKLESRLRKAKGKMKEFKNSEVINEYIAESVTADEEPIDAADIIAQGS